MSIKFKTLMRHMRVISSAFDINMYKCVWLVGSCINFWNTKSKKNDKQKYLRCSEKRKFYCPTLDILNFLVIICRVFSFRVCKSVHHHTFNWINQPDAANSQVYYLSFKYSSTAGRPARPRPKALLPPRSDGKTRGCYCNCGSWWWAWGCPKHIELYLNDK